MSYSSASEGEIVESEGEKATTTRPSTKDSAVNRKNRPRSVSRSPRPPQLDGTYDDLSGLDYGDNRSGRHGSHGPYDRPAQGQKRRHEDDSHYDRSRGDTRRFKVHYESHGSSDDRRHDQRFYRDDDRRNGASNGHGRGGGREHYQSDRQRNRSRSPHRDGRYGPSGANGGRPDTRRDDRDRFRDRRPDSGPGYSRHAEDVSRSRRSSIYSRESTPPSARREDLRTEHRHAPAQEDTVMKDAPSGKRDASGITTAATSDAQEDVSEPVVVDEAKLIEERRKRREALRAKHKGQGTPLLHKALHVSTISQPATPSTESDARFEQSADSPFVASPSTPGSPAMFSVTNDEELANRTQMDEKGEQIEGPSAADYDPTMDMQEGKMQKTIGTGESAAGAYDETKEQDRDVIIPKDTPKPVEALKEFDMFAEDDDDDMFAMEPKLGHRKEDGTQVERIPEAKQLDRSLLDDWDDPEGYYRIILGELLDGRYHVQTNLGKGVFSAVVRAKDTVTGKDVAIKIIRTQETMYKAGMKEIETLQKILEADPEDKKHIIRLERHFEHKGHLCMVFESLSDNLREVLKKFGRDVGINIKAVRSYAQQMFLGLSLLKKCEILHADLKPDNVLVNEQRSSLKIADLGSAIDARDNEITDTLVSRFYRAPEIVLGMEYDYAIDMWSIGCTLFELYTGKICFTGVSNNQMLKGIMECRGKVPNRMLKRAAFWDQHFLPDGTFQSQDSKGLSPADARELHDFVDLLEKCLALDPARRITPIEALKHKFISRSAAIPKA
ncbi:U4/U6 small nuclear ribonucleoprotein prp4 [Taxawa tesnikishii (nom. ined.)]|nr:U4/U6 small nuclear ribonucleoprotein prp4 [Dothideales sp. JES 119]